MRLVRLFQEPRLPSAKNKKKERKNRRKQAYKVTKNETVFDVDEGRILMDIHNQRVGRRVSYPEYYSDFILFVLDIIIICHLIFGLI